MNKFKPVDRDYLYGEVEYECLVCKHPVNLDERGFYECSVCGHSGWEGECYHGYPEYRMEEVES